MRRIVGFLALLLGMVGAWSVSPAGAWGGPRTLYVGTTLGSGRNCASPGFTSVQAAVDAAQDGATVFLCGSTAYAGEVFVSKPITLTGDDGASLSAPASYPAPASVLARLPSEFATDTLFVPQAILVVSGAGTEARVSNLGITGPLPGNDGCANEEFGVLVIGGAGAELRDDSVTGIEDANAALDGCQFGVGIQVGREYWPTADFSSYVAENFVGQASISDTTVSAYAKNGITVDGPGSSADLHDDTVTGFGPTTVVAQNGIQISRGADARVHDDTVSADQYTGTGGASSAGILLYGGCGDPLVTGVDVRDNTIVNDDMGIALANYDATCSQPPAQRTEDAVDNNTLSNDAITNVSGYGSGIGYQAGIVDTGNGDEIHGNSISGVGYTPAENTPTMVVVPIDTSLTTEARVRHNKIA